MMMTPIRIGIAVACLVGVAILIAVDLGNSRKQPDPVPAASPSVPLTAPPPPVLPPAQRANLVAERHHLVEADATVVAGAAAADAAGRLEHLDAVEPVLIAHGIGHVRGALAV